MHVGIFIGLFVAVVVLPLLSFLRNGAILRGGAVAAMHRERRDEEGSSAAGPQDAMWPSSVNDVKTLAGAKAPELDAQKDGESISLAEASLPKSQSSQVFYQARRRADIQKRKLELIQQRGGDAAEVAEVAAAAGSDVASAWDQKQLCADDNIRLAFLFVFVFPVFALWCWGLRNVRPPHLLYLYCHLRGAHKEETSPELQAALCAAPVVALLGTWSLAFLYYAFFVYLDHRDKDVSLKRHSNTQCSRAVNWFKFRVYRRYVNFQCYLWKRYFSLQLVPAYGPLPLFLFPDGRDEALLPHESTSTEAMRSSSVGSGRATGRTPLRSVAATTASARHNPFYIAVSSSAGEGSPLDMPLQLLPSSSPIDTPAFITAYTSKNTSAANSGLSDKSWKPSPAPEGEECESNASDDWDEEERGLLRTRSDADTARPAQPSSSDDLAGTADADSGHTKEPSSSFSSADPAKVTSSPSPQPMRRAHYFFAAHPHGILPWCCCVNLISNVTKRDEKLFVDNRAAVLRPLPEDTDAPVSAEGTVVSPVSAGSPKGNTFTTSRARGMTSPSMTSAALLPTGAATEPVVTARTTASLSLNERRQQEGNYVPPLNKPATATVNYARGVYYTYHVPLKKFVLRLDKDEAVPSSAADAAVYKQRLQAEENKRAAKQRASSTGGASPPLRQRLKIRIRAVVASFPFYVPIMREIYMFHGYMDASYETCKRVLLYNNSTRREREGLARAPATHEHPTESPSGGQSKAASQRGNNAGRDSSWSDDSDDDESTLPEDLNHLMLFPGGASEALLSSSHGPARVLLRRRKGFLRLALHTQSGLVPVYTFGETDYFDQFNTATTRYAAPLDDDSTLISLGESTLREAGKASMEASVNIAKGSTTQQHCRSAASYYRKVIPSGTDEEDETNSSSSRSPLRRAPSPTTAVREAKHSHMKEVEKRLLRDEEDARSREGRFPRSPAQTLPGGPDRPRGQLSGASNTAAAAGATLPPPSAEAQEPVAKGGKSSTGRPAATPSSPAAGRLPRFIQAVQRLFQETFGISLPVVRNLIPHRVTGATVVGRPIYFELPPELLRMYTDPANFYDREKERAVLAAAQEVYFNELQELFLKYAPRYLKDPSRRKLEIL
ncbi:hypothetical protein ABL78_2948 [Leptomonas seymouri]|uniref:diacylglycerol O-acyltransferase n=1 Tax=Leptomonas seymouri TaxID=5684 RepID=A0A0N0P762_LEPSE|nr:hypothetical protein ABL78_2948 [Leptomonas seymouri]|eukprot:KPI87957.1 hypothetical protein ABL78_2948 [Leptomonas seymouri]